MQMRFEFCPACMWIGLHRETGVRSLDRGRVVHWFVNFLPCLSIHLTWEEDAGTVPPLN